MMWVSSVRTRASSSVGLEDEVVHQVEHAVVPVHADVSGPDGLHLGKHSLLDVVERPVVGKIRRKGRLTSCRLAASQGSTGLS